MLSPLFRFFQNWKRYGLAVQELSHLSDRELADIGITRSDIPRIAWEHTHERCAVAPVWANKRTETHAHDAIVAPACLVR
jgi:uncharacterized protein YjiS (DUF1127 family)